MLHCNDYTNQSNEFESPMRKLKFTDPAHFFVPQHVATENVATALREEAKIIKQLQPFCSYMFGGEKILSYSARN